MTLLCLRSASATATVALGKRLAGHLRAGDVVLLHGDLGSGKTTLAQGIIAGLGVAEPTASPTFTLANEYRAPATGGLVVHLDLYRLAESAELDSIGLDDYLHPTDGISLVEWPERAADRLGPGMLLVQLAHSDAGARLLSFAPWVDSVRYLWLPELIMDSASHIPGISVVPSGDIPGTT